MNNSTWYPDVTPISSLTRPWTVFLIHHTHTDIGYTEHQKKVERYHVQFLEDVVDIWREVQAGAAPDLADFRWTNETFWSVERFLERTTPEYRRDFEAAVKAGFIGLNGTYLHNAELGDVELLRKTVRRGVDYAEKLGVTVDSAMSCDINGVGWGHALALADAGISNYFSCLHVHKGGCVGAERQRPFYWELPDGRKILVWNGEVYALGNVLGLAPRGAFTYLIYDELAAAPAMIGQDLLVQHRLGRYLAQLEADRHPYPFVPIMVGSMATDNGPASRDLQRYINDWNDRFGKQVTLKMVTLGDFFKHARENIGADVPTWRGDWPDWWTDGVISIPQATRIFRHAQRQWRTLSDAVQAGKAVTDGKLLQEAEDALGVYIEHTFNHSDSTIYPWDFLVKTVGGAKETVAHRAYEKTLCAWDATLQGRGETRQVFDRPPFYRIWNPLPRAVTGVAEIYLEYPEFGLVDRKARVRDVKTGALIPHQKIHACRGVFLLAQVSLPAWGEMTVEVEAVPETVSTVERQVERAGLAGDAAGTEAGLGGWKTENFSGASALTTSFVEIAWQKEQGIVGWVDKTTGRSLLRGDALHGPFVPVYQVTRAEGSNNSDAQYQVRGNLGRNRIGANGSRDVGKLTQARIVDRGPLFCSAELEYKVESCGMYRVILRAYREMPRVDVSVRIHKQSVWDPETLYISLPFVAGAGATLWLDKAGVPVRPRVDQLPNSLCDYYSIQEGFVSSAADFGVAVASPDAPLVQLGSLDYGVRLLQGHPRLAEDKGHAYSWVMNTCWETNFDVNVGGFHEFRYSLFWGNDLATPQAAFDTCRAANVGLKTYRLDQRQLDRKT